MMMREELQERVFRWQQVQEYREEAVTKRIPYEHQTLKVLSDA